MIKRRLQNERNRMDYPEVQDGANPLENMANLVDVMLVLVVGILCALVVYWGVDLKNSGQQVQMTAGYDEVQVEETVEDLVDEGDLTEYGTLYVDSEGNYYVKTK